MHCLRKARWACLEEERLLANGVRAKHEQRRRLTPIPSASHLPHTQRHYTLHYLLLQRERVLWQAVCRVQVQDHSISQRAKGRIPLKKRALVAAVARVQHSRPSGRFEDEHDGARAVVGGDARDVAVEDRDWVPDADLTDVSWVHL